MSQLDLGMVKTIARFRELRHDNESKYISKYKFDQTV